MRSLWLLCHFQLSMNPYVTMKEAKYNLKNEPWWAGPHLEKLGWLYDFQIQKEKTVLRWKPNSKYSSNLLVFPKCTKFCLSVQKLDRMTPFHIEQEVGKVTVAHYDLDVNMYQFSWQRMIVSTFNSNF